jgi:hypothetical protein
MRLRLIAFAGAAAVMAGLSACAYDEAYYGPPVAYADVDYEAYYDGFYGPFYGGYWGPGERFYYWDQNHRHYHADAGMHFSRQGMPGFNAVRGHAPQIQGRASGPPGGPRGPR